MTDDEGAPQEAPAKVAKYAREALHTDCRLEMQDRDGLDSAETLMHKEGLRHARDQSHNEKTRAVAMTKTERNARKRLGQKERRAAQKTPA